MTTSPESSSGGQNVRVCCRFRPVNKIEKTSKSHKLVAKISNDCKSVLIRGGRKNKNFCFDYVYPSNSNQQSVFNHTGRPLIESVLGGYNCTLFAYGQTGSGKTYSMEGIIGDPPNEGLIPRMVRAIFDEILDEDNTDNALTEYTLRVSFVEIYNEKLRDLLQPNGPPLKIREQTKSGHAKGVYIENVHSPFVASPDDVFDHLHSGHVNRSVASTRMNENSSRSHAVFMLQIDQRNTETGSSKMSKLMMVDLAGSEKVRKTNATGQTLKEAQQINKSLMVLGLVINSLVEGKKHIPYRDSKLTRLLSDALGGNSKTCLLVTASPSKYNVEETISTLRFGQRAKSIKNTAKVNQELSVSEYKKLLEKHKKREEILKQQIKALQMQLDAIKKYCEDKGIDLQTVLKNSHKQSGTQAAVMVPQSNTSKANQEANIVQITALQVSLEKEQQLRVKASEECDRLKEELEDVRQELQTANDTYTEERSEIDQMTSQLTVSQQRTTQLTVSLKSANTKLKTAQNDLTQEREDRADDKEKYELEIHKKDSTVQELEMQYTKLKEQMQQIRENSTLPRNAATKDNNTTNMNSDMPSPSPSLEGVPQKEGVQSKIIPSGLDQQKFAQFVATARKLQQKSDTLGVENEKLRTKLKAYKRRDEVNKQLRENWNKQLEQMEQAVIVANEIYHRERARHEEELSQKDIEITKLRQFLLSFTNRHQSNIRNKINPGNALSPRVDRNAPGARKSKIIMPKVIKPGQARVSGYSSSRSNGNVAARQAHGVSNGEKKGDF